MREGGERLAEQELLLVSLRRPRASEGVELSETAAAVASARRARGAPPLRWWRVAAAPAAADVVTLHASAASARKALQAAVARG
jgi:hypothetical protein